MDASGPDGDDVCDLEDGTLDDGPTGVCPPPNLSATKDSFTTSHSVQPPGMMIGQPGVLANDNYDPNPMIPVTITHVVLPQHGTLDYHPWDKSFNYDPDNDYATCVDAGTYTYCYDAFYYFFTQAGGDSNMTVAEIKITNQKPVANDDSIATMKDMPTTVNVVGPNDMDLDPNDVSGLQISSITLRSVNPNDPNDKPHGTVTYSGKNVTYQPDSGYVGDDWFWYTISDGLAGSNSAKVMVHVTESLILDAPPAEQLANVPAITEADVASLAEEAARRWILAGANPMTVQLALEGTKIVVADLPGSALGGEVPGTIVIDVNAAGYGWYVDASPSLDEEFDIAVAPSELQARRGSKAFGYVDALTVLMHEFGHAIGMVHLEGEEFEHSVMHDTLSLSTRRTPTAADILASDEYFANLWASGSTVKRRKW